jgi:RNA polymerase sigma-70 factor (ECF subfamily)
MSNRSNEFVSSLFERYGRDLSGFLKTRLETQEAEDVAQKTYLKLLQHPNPDAIHNPHAYLFKTAANLALDHLRRRTGWLRRHISDCTGAESSSALEAGPDATVDSVRQLQRFREALASLPPICRTVFLLNRIDGLTHKEIAQRVGISKKSVERYIIKALERCQRRLGRPQE